MPGTRLFPKMNKATFPVLKELVVLYAERHVDKELLMCGQCDKVLSWQKAE